MNIGEGKDRRSGRGFGRRRSERGRSGIGRESGGGLGSVG